MMSERLCCAVWEGNLYEVRRLIESEGVDPHGRDWWGRTALEISCAHYHLNLVRYLVEEQSCDPNSVNRREHTPLYCACGCGCGWSSRGFASSRTNGSNSRTDVVKYLVETCHCDPMCVDEDGWTPLHWAASEGHWDVVKYLIETCHCDPICVDKDGRNPLHLAASKRHLAAGKGRWEYLIDTCHCDPMCVEKNEWTPLHWAVGKGYMHVVKYLIETCHCDPMCVDKNGTTPLHFAANERCWDVVKYLTETCHCDPMCADKDGRTPLHYAVTESDLYMVKYLIDTCHCQPKCVDNYGWTPLHWAVRKHNMVMVKYLIETCHCDPMFLDKERKTALHWATVSEKNLNMMEYLVEICHCDPMCVDRDGRTPLHLAVTLANKNITEYLLVRCKCNPNCKDKDGYTPLDLDVKNTELHSCARILLDAGAKTTAKPPLPPVKIFIVGNPSVGKSSLTKSLQTETSAKLSFIAGSRLVRNVEQKTAGIVPCQFTSRIYGEVTFFDFAGQQEYYASHAALLKNSISSATPVFIIVVHLCDNKENVEQNLVFWLTFLSNQCTSVTSKPHVIIVGSHSDVVKSHGSVNIERLQTLNVSKGFHIYQLIAMDCRKYNSCDMCKLRTSLKSICDIVRKQLDVLTRLHYLFVFLLDRFKCVSAVTCEDVQRLASSESLEIPLRHNNPDYLYRSCEELDKAGYIIFIKKCDIAKSWIVLDQAALLSEVNGILFAPESFKQHCNLANATGVVPVSRIAEKFPQHDQEMLVLFLSHFEFCSEIQDDRVLQLINQNCSRQSEQAGLSNERYLFFPGLVSSEFPCGVWDADTKFPHFCGWMLQCSESGQYFTSQFLQVLLLRIAFSCALASDAPGSGILQRKCLFWRNGIYWCNRKGVKALLEFRDPPQIREVVVMLCCLADREMECAHLRSTIIQLVLKAKEQFCASVETKQFFIHPSLVQQYPFKCDHSKHGLVSVTEVENAIAEGDNLLINDALEQIDLKDLLIFSHQPKGETVSCKLTAFPFRHTHVYRMIFLLHRCTYH